MPPFVSVLIPPSTLACICFSWKYIAESDVSFVSHNVYSVTARDGLHTNMIGAHGYGQGLTLLFTKCSSSFFYTSSHIFIACTLVVLYNWFTSINGHEPKNLNYPAVWDQGVPVTLTLPGCNDRFHCRSKVMVTLAPSTVLVRVHKNITCCCPLTLRFYYHNIIL